MSVLLRVDGLFAAFCDSFSGALREEARRLSFTLGFAPEPLLPWSQVFSHEVTLAAPSLVAEAMPGVPEACVLHALFAHTLAVVEAMGTDRIRDGQVVATPLLRQVLAAARAVRDEQLALAAGGEEASLPLDATDRDVADAVGLERRLLLEQRSVDFMTYEALSERKQAPGILASEALAARAGWDGTKRRALGRVLIGVGMGLQLYDDVVDWEGDAAHGCSWALALTRPHGSSIAPSGAGVDARRLRAEVHASGVLARLLRRSHWHFRSAAKRASALGALKLARWADERADFLRRLAEREEKHAGYVNRAHSLAPWARTVLA
jgi:hypothetical protein